MFHLTKCSNGSGFFPTYMCNECIFTFIPERYRKDAHEMEKELGEYLEVIRETSMILKVRIKDPSKYLVSDVTIMDQT